MKVLWNRLRGFLGGDAEPDEEPARDVADMLGSRRRRRNVPFNARTRGRSPTQKRRRKELREAVMHCVVTDRPGDR